MIDAATVPARRGFLTHLLAMAAGVGAFAAACWGLTLALPFPDVPAIKPKYEFLKLHGDRYEVLFVGSSRFYHQIIPQEFDRAVEAQTGRKMRSFNCAYDAVWPPESYYFLRKILALRPARLKWVVIDAMKINPNLKAENEVTRRDAYWHDWRHTQMALGALGEIETLDRPRRQMLSDAHWTSFFKQQVNIGRGTELLNARMEARKRGEKKVKRYEWETQEGYEAGGLRGLDEQEAATYAESVRKMTSLLTPVPPSPTFAKALAEISAEVRAAGAEPIFVITPTISREENLSEIPGGAKLLALNDPRRYPTLYQPEMHYDAFHLNPRGAAEFTSLLAREFCQALAPAK